MVIHIKAVWGDQTYPTVTLYDGQGRISELRTFRKWPHTTGITGPDENTVNTATVTVDSTSWSYNETTGRLYQKYYPDGTDADPNRDLAFTYTYTTAGRLDQRVSGRGITTTYGYHAGFLTSVGYVVPTGSGLPATPNLTYTYDSMGRLDTVKRGSTLHAQYHYTGLKLTSEDLNLDTACPRTLTRTYEDLPDGLPGYRPDGYSFTEGTGQNAVTYSANWSFDTAGRPSALTDGTDTFTYGYTYTAAGGLHTGTPMSTPSAIPFTLDGPQVDVTLAYDATRDTLVSRSNSTSTSNPLSKFTYNVNALGQREGVATTGTAFGATPANSDRTWQFDPLGQVLSSDSTGTPNDRAYTYDSIGNRKAAQADATTIPSSPTAATTAYTANGANQYSSITVGTGGPMNPAPANDADGNMTTGPVPGVAGLTPGVPAPSSATLKWDAENRLVEASVGEITLSYDYDYLGRLISRDDETTRTFYLYDGWNRIAEHSQTDSATPALSKVNLWGLDLSGTPQGAGGVGGLLSILDKPTGSRYYPAYDGNGNVSEYITTTNGQPTQAAHFEYDPFGNLTADSGSHAADFPFRFSTKLQDAVTGLIYYGYRWYDPLTGRWPSRDPIGEEGGLNLHGFVGNDGADLADILGLAFFHISFIRDDEGFVPSTKKETYPGGPELQNPPDSLGTTLIKYDITAGCKCVKGSGSAPSYYIIESLYVGVYSHISLPNTFRFGEKQKEWAMDNEGDHAAAIEKYFKDNMKRVERILDELEKALRANNPHDHRFASDEKCKEAARKAVEHALSWHATNAAAKSKDVDKFLKRKHNWVTYNEDLERARDRR